MSTPAAEGPVLVLGLGNVLLSDEGVGVRVVQRLEHDYCLPADVTVIDGGTSGMELLEPIAECRHLLVVDAVRTGQPPGTRVRLEGEEVPAFFGTKISPHQVALSDVLASLQLTGEHPGHITVLGVEPESLETGMGLSTTVAARLEELLADVIEELTALGRAALPRTTAGHAAS